MSEDWGHEDCEVCKAASRGGASYRADSIRVWEFNDAYRRGWAVWLEFYDGVDGTLGVSGVLRMNHLELDQDAAVARLRQAARELGIEVAPELELVTGRAQ